MYMNQNSEKGYFGEKKGEEAMPYRISLKVTYIKTICIDGVEYVNTDYKPSKTIMLGVPYIKYININGNAYKNLDYNKNSVKTINP